jgi:hypothetical protein
MRALAGFGVLSQRFFLENARFMGGKRNAILCRFLNARFGQAHRRAEYSTLPLLYPIDRSSHGNSDEPEPKFET